MSHSALAAGLSRVAFKTHLALVERQSVARLFDGAAETRDSELDRIAAFADLVLEGHLPDEEMKQTFDDIAHALCDAHDILSRPSVEKQRIAEMSAFFFAIAGYSAKAATIAGAYATRRRAFIPLETRGADEERAIAIRLADKALWALTRVDRNLIVSAEYELTQQIGKTLFGDEGRFAFLLSGLLGGVLEILTAETILTTHDQIAARCELLAEIARRTHGARLFQLAERIAFTALEVSSSAANVVLRSASLRLTETMRNSLVGSSVAKVPIMQLWPSQRRVLEKGYLAANDFVISAPTSAGKTLLAELRVARYLSGDPNGLAIYVAPYNALASQIAGSLTQRFSGANIEPAALWTGAYEIDASALYVASLLVTTPEKLDSLLRLSKMGDERAEAMFLRAGLYIFDECHLIGANPRGITYELLISRIKSRFRDAQCLAMSAVADNASTLGLWLANRSNSAVVETWTPTRRRLLVLGRDGALRDLAGVEIHRIAKWSVPKKAVVDSTHRCNNLQA